MGRDGSLGESDEELASQQGEMLLRGLAKLRTDFVFAVTAAPIARGDLSKALVKMARVASQVASRHLRKLRFFIGMTSLVDGVWSTRRRFANAAGWMRMGLGCQPPPRCGA